ncbi:MAG: NAD(+) synthase [Eubacteriales bacterium]|nr:NAD(+) synthase [Eubacteriales bacterium]
MKQGFIKTAAGSVGITVADTSSNAGRITERISEADRSGVNLLVLPELCLTGYTCGDLFLSDALLDSVEPSLEKICADTAGAYPVTVLGLPFRYLGKLFNCAAVIHGGRILGLVPKTYIPGYGEFYEARQFSSGKILGDDVRTVKLCGQDVPFGNGIVFRHEALRDYSFGIEICEDLWVPCPPCERLTASGANIICNPSASDEVIGKEGYRRLLVSSTSARLACGYVYSNAAPSESTQDMVFSNHHIIAENGTLLAENRPFEENGLIVSEIDVARLTHERHRITTYDVVPGGYEVIFPQEIRETELTRHFDRNPFVPPHDAQINERAGAILRIQSYGLKKRLEHARAKTAVIGISGGLDSTLALLVAVRAMDILGRDRHDIKAVTMPCFGTTKRTKSNAVRLCEELGVSVSEINITAAVRQHFADIGHDESILDVTYENCQARERTQVLMDIANKTGGLVIGTGDLSELALGWATYNGDHMSMYGVNTSVPKTLVRYIVIYEAEKSGGALAGVLYDILDTPVSPELLPAKENGEIAQKTEDLVGPYELHDFFLYHMMRFGSSPAKIFRLAKYAYAGAYTDDTILHWLKTFVRRFFIQQFKRSCMPDGPKVGTVTLSPRGDLRMPSDASFAVWMKELDSL